MADKNNIPQFVNSDSFMADKNYVKWLSDLKKRFRMAQLKAAVKVNTEMLKFYWGLGEDICEKQKQYKWGANFMKRLSLDLRAEFPQAEGFSFVNLYYIKRWYKFYSSHSNFFYQAGKKLQEVDNANTPIPEILLCVPWRHQTVIVSKCTTISAALFYLNKVVEDNMSRTELEHVVKACGMNPIICEKRHRGHPLTDEQKQNNRKISKSRCRVEHIFGFIEGAMHGSIVRSIGMVRAEANIALTCLVYNIFRYTNRQIPTTAHRCGGIIVS